VFDERVPIYRQIADQIRGDVLAGHLEPGDQVMSTNQYASFHRINPATARKAFQELVSEGVLVKRRGIGMFIADGADERLRAQRRATFAERVVQPMVTEAQHLGISVEELLASVRQRAGADGLGGPGAQGGPQEGRAR
jgi:GntR family transcriptional regulator